MKTLSRAITVAIVLGSLGAFGWVASNALESSSGLAGVRLAPFIGAIALHLTMLVLLMLLWERLVSFLSDRSSGGKLEVPGTGLHTAYSRSWLARYIPGRVWALGGRIFLASKIGVPAEAVARSMAFEVLFSYGIVSVLGAAIIAAVKVHFLAGGAVLLAGFGVFALGIPAAQSLLTARSGLGSRHPLWRKLNRSAHRLLVGHNPLTARKTLWGIGVYGLYGCLQLAFIVLVAASFTDLTMEQAAIIAGGWALSITVGWISFLTPVGLGVREGLAFVLFAQVLDSSTAALIVATARLAMIATDLTFVGLIELFALGLRLWTGPSANPAPTHTPERVVMEGE